MDSARLRVSVLSTQVLCSEPVAAQERPKVAIIIGAGAGIGVNVAKRFAKAGMFAVLCRRSNGEGLKQAVDEIRSAGGQAEGFLLDMVTPGAMEDVISKVEAEIGEIHVAVYNLGAQIGNRPLESISLKKFEQGWRMGCEGLFRLARALLPSMVKRGGGTVLCTSATSAMRGNAGQHSHASAVGGRRLLLESLNAEFAPQGIHLCHIVVDSAVNAPDTLGKLVGPEAFAKIQAMGDQVVQPDELAETYYHLAKQHRSAWTFELDIRPYSQKPWWNS